MRGDRLRATPRAMPALELTRRTFLGRSLQAAGALAVLPALACAPAAAPGSDAGLLAVHAGELPILEAVAQTFVPAGGAFASADVDLARRIRWRRPRARMWCGVREDSDRRAREPAPPGRVARFSALSPVDVRACGADGEPVLARDGSAGLKQPCLFTSSGMRPGRPPDKVRGAPARPPRDPEGAQLTAARDAHAHPRLGPLAVPMAALWPRRASTIVEEGGAPGMRRAARRRDVPRAPPGARAAGDGGRLVSVPRAPASGLYRHQHGGLQLTSAVYAHGSSSQLTRS
jgi:hypothetical protein